MFLFQAKKHLGWDGDSNVSLCGWNFDAWTCYSATQVLMRNSTVCACKMQNLHTVVSMALLVAVAIANVKAENCEMYSLSMPYNGRYCTGVGTVTRKLLPHQCRFMCLQSAICKAYNYNTTSETCTRFTSPCPQAIGDPVMEFVVFRETFAKQCYEWVPYSPGDTLDERMISTDTSVIIVARLEVDGNHLVCYFFYDSACYCSLGPTQYSNTQGYPCDRLRVVEGCTVFWVPYTAGEPIPTQAVIGGSMANGDVAYVIKFGHLHTDGQVWDIAGYYVEGTPQAISPFHGVHYSTNVMMMVVL